MQPFIHLFSAQTKRPAVVAKPPTPSAPAVAIPAPKPPDAAVTAETVPNKFITENLKNTKHRLQFRGAPLKRDFRVSNSKNFHHGTF